jgi:hypothetical protein
MTEIKAVSGQTILVDDADYDTLSAHRWYVHLAHKVYYATADVNRHRISIHQMIMNAPKGVDVDHINGNGLDNRRSNLRLATRGQNIANSRMYSNNTTGYRGVIAYGGGWRAQLKCQQRLFTSPNFKTKEEAALFRDELVRVMLGDTVYLNFPDVETPPQIKVMVHELVLRRGFAGHLQASLDRVSRFIEEQKVA